MANNFTFTTLPDTTTPRSILMEVDDGTSSVSEVFPIASARLTFNDIKFTGNIQSSVAAGGGDDKRQTITISGAVWGSSVSTQTELNALINANEVCVYISGAQVSTIPNGWYRVFGASIASNTITINTFATLYPVITVPGGTVSGDTPRINLVHPDIPGAYFHGFRGGAATAPTDASTLTVNTTAHGSYVGARKVAELLTQARVI
jgi:hypothetical protein